MTEFGEMCGVESTAGVENEVLVSSLPAAGREVEEGIILHFPAGYLVLCFVVFVRSQIFLRGGGGLSRLSRDRGPRSTPFEPP
jgi:hypothetical protein